MVRKTSEPYISTYLHSKGRKLGLPIAGNFELSARCNFNCPMCYVHLSNEEVEKQGKELSAKQWLKIAEDAKNQGMIFVLLTGGEPLLRKDFFEIYKGMKKMGLYISINTNGSLLRGEILEKFLEDPPYRFNISLYGGSNETYAKMCGLPMYDLVKNNIKKLREAGITVSLNVSITPYNCEDIEKIYRDAVELDVNVKATTYMYPSIRVHGEYGQNDRLNAKEAAYYAMKWDALRFSEEEFKIRAKNMSHLCFEKEEDCPLECEEGVRCRAGSSSFWVCWDGRMLPCGMMQKPVVYPLKDGFDQAWEELKTKTSEIRTPKKCSACKYRDVCGMCSAVCYSESGSFNKVPTYMCEKIEHQIYYAKKWVEENEK